MRGVVNRPDADRDIREQARHIGRGRPDVGRQFSEAVARVARQVAASPGMGAPYAVSNPALAGLRCVSVPKFRNHLVFYLTVDDRVEDVRVLHGARDVDRVLDDEEADEED